MKLVVVGTGYVGLVTGACFADLGHDVVCVDNDKKKIGMLRRGRMPIFEPGLADLVQLNCSERRLSFSSELRTAVADVDAAFIAVGTPSRPIDGHADRSFVFAAAREMATALPDDAIVVIKSTVPVGTGDEVAFLLRGMRDGRAIPVVANPEFLRAGSAIKDFMEPDRVVIGMEDPEAGTVMRRIYQPMQLAPAPLQFTARRSAELIKYGANALLATKIAFINEIADLCERAGADVREVSRGIGLDRRIGARFLNPGPGFGGSCFRKDTQALVKVGEDHDVTLRIAEAAVASNECRKRKLLQKVAAAIPGSLNGKVVAVWGLTFKANTSDVRESPAIPLITALLDAGARVQIYDPEGMPAAEQLWPGQVSLARDALAAVRRADVLVIMTEWQEFGAANLARVASLMAAPVVVDMRAMYEPGYAAQFGIAYHAIGRAPERSSDGVRSARAVNGHPNRGEPSVRKLPAEDDVMPAASP